MKNVLIYGASGHGKMIADIIKKNNEYNLIGFIDSFLPIGHSSFGYTVLGNLDLLPSIIKEFNIEGIAIGIGNNNQRRMAHSNIVLRAPELPFITAIHPSAILAEGVLIPEGTVAMAGAIVNADAKVGKFCVLNTKASLGHDSTMADFSSLASGVTIGGNVKIGFGSEICIGASIGQEISIGDHTIIGGGSLVLKSIGDFKLAYGVPIHTIKKRELNLKFSA